MPLVGKPNDDEYESMVMTLENSGAETTSDFVKVKLLQEKTGEMENLDVEKFALNYKQKFRKYETNKSRGAGNSIK